MAFWAKPGVKVICINDAPKGPWTRPNGNYAPDTGESFLIRRGEIYTIQWVGPIESKYHPNCGDIIVILKECPTRPITTDGEKHLDGYAIERFRPLNKNFKMLEEMLHNPIKTNARKVKESLNV